MSAQNRRAWSTFVVKSVDESQRTIEGIASTPNTDRVGDIVEPQGAQFKLPLPFLMHHDSEQPVGHVIAASPTKAGIGVQIQLAKTTEPGTLRDRLDEAFQSIKLGLVRGLSIGFKPVEYSYIEATGGVHFTKWDWLELSAVTIPANSDASITSIKRFDTGVKARSTAGVRLSFLKRESPKFPKDWREITPDAFASRLSKQFLDTFGELIVEGFSKQNVRIKSLRDELDARTYKGVHNPTESYRKHNMVTMGGHIWIALCDTDTVPGRSADWQLAVKKGRDAR